jgi:hypothetical protein
VEGIRRCLDQLCSVEQAAKSGGSAYRFRTRLSRLDLSCTRMLATQYDLEEPILPGRFDAGPTVVSSHRQIAACANRLFAIGDRLGQPSEPLETDGWDRGMSCCTASGSYVLSCILRQSDESQRQARTRRDGPRHRRRR